MHHKSSHFWTPFSITFSIPFWDPLLKSLLAHLGPPRCRPWPPHVDFGPFLVPPWAPKWRLGVPRVTQNRAQNGSWRRPVSRRGPESHSYRFWDPPGWPRRLFGTPLGDRRCVWGTPLGDKALIFIGIWPSAQHNLTQPNPTQHNTTQHNTTQHNITR